MTFKVKKLINRSFKDLRGYYWTSWKRGVLKNLKFKHDKFSLSKKNSSNILVSSSEILKLIALDCFFLASY